MTSDVQAAREGLSNLEKLPPEQQATVLAAPYAVRSLAYSGQGAQALALIEKLPPEQQATVLAAPNAVWGLWRTTDRVRRFSRALKSSRPNSRPPCWPHPMPCRVW